MKHTTNQELRNMQQASVALIRAIYYIAFVIPASHIVMLIDAVCSFVVGLGNDLKKCFQVISLVFLFLVSTAVFAGLFIRALDIESDAQEMVLAEYQESLKDNQTQGE